MSDILEKNLECMEKFRTSYYNKVKAMFESGEYKFEKLEYPETRDNNHALVIEDENGKHRLNSLYRPIQEADKWSEQFQYKNLSVSVIMFGLGNGLFAKSMLKKLSSDGIAYIYEPDIEVFLYILEREDLTEIFSDPRVRLIISDLADTGLKLGDFKKTLEAETDWTTLSSRIVCSHPEYEKLYKDEYREFNEIVDRAAAYAVTNKNTLQYMSKRVIRNVLKNLHFIKESNYISEFIGKFPENYPAIIVSAGPSLSKNIDELKRAENRAFILATDTAVKHLMRHDIHIDGIISIDPKKALGHLKDPKCFDVPFFCVLDTKNEFMENNTARKIWFKGGYYIEDLYKKFGHRFPPYNAGGSVATAAFSVCISLKIKKIILIGQDLAYLGESTHAGNVVKKIVDEDKSIMYVDGVDGEKVKSRYDWIMYRDWFEASITELKDYEVIDATEGGALIHGSEVMTLAEAIDKYCTREFSVRQMINDMPYTFDSEDYKKVRDEMFHMKREFVNIRQRSAEGIKIADELIRMGKNGVDDYAKESKYTKQLRKINNFVGKQMCYELIETYITDEVADRMADINVLTDDEDQNLVDTANIAKVVYENMVKAIDELTPVLDEELQKI